MSQWPVGGKYIQASDTEKVHRELTSGNNQYRSSTGTQEGCHFSTSTQATVLGYLRTELNSRGLSSTIISASDENSYDVAVSTWNSLVSAGATGNVGRINVHGYQQASGRRDTRKLKLCRDPLIPSSQDTLRNREG